jgi:hypothetical protein
MGDAHLFILHQGNAGINLGAFCKSNSTIFFKFLKPNRKITLWEIWGFHNGNNMVPGNLV